MTLKISFGYDATDIWYCLENFVISVDLYFGVNLQTGSWVVWLTSDMGAAGEQGGCPGTALRLHRTVTLGGAEVVTGACWQRENSWLNSRKCRGVWHILGENNLKNYLLTILLPLGGWEWTGYNGVGAWGFLPHDIWVFCCCEAERRKPRRTLIFINQPHEAICLTRHQQSSLLAAVRQGEKGYETAT